MSQPPTRTTGVKGQVTTVEPSRAERALARRGAETRAIVPSVELGCQVELDACLELAGRRGAQPLALLLAVLARTARQFPRLNGAYRDGRYELYSRVNLGIALPGPEGSMIATLFDAAERDLVALDTELSELTERAATGRLSAADLSGSTLTVTPPGPLGVTLLTPLIQSPQAAAVAVGAWVPAPVARSGELTTVQVSAVTLACDHRIVQPHLAADFLHQLKRSLEAPAL